MTNENFEFGFEMQNEGEALFAPVDVPEDFINTEEVETQSVQEPETTETKANTPEEPVVTANTPSEQPEQPEQTEQTAEETSEKPESNYGELFRNHFNLLKEAGLIYAEDLELNEDASNIEEVLQQNEMARTQLIAEQLVENMPDKLKQIVQYGLSGGDNLDQFFQIEKQIGEFTHDISTEQGQEAVLIEYLKSKGNDDFAISAIVDRAKDDRKLEDLAKSAYTSIKDDFEKKKQTLIEESKRKAQQQEQLTKERHNQVIETIKKQDKWNQKAKEEIYSLIYKPDQKYDGNSYIGAVLNKISSTPEHLVQFAKLITDQYDFEKGFNITDVQEQSNKIKNGLREQLGAVLQKNATPNNYQQERKQEIDWSKTQVVLPEWY